MVGFTSKFTDVGRSVGTRPSDRGDGRPGDRPIGRLADRPFGRLADRLDWSTAGSVGRSHWPTAGSVGQWLG